MVEKLDFISDNSVELIYACHLLEHFGRYSFEGVLREWYRVLEQGGILRLAVPDFASCARIYYEEGLLDGLSGVSLSCVGACTVLSFSGAGTSTAQTFRLCSTRGSSGREMTLSATGKVKSATWGGCGA